MKRWRCIGWRVKTLEGYLSCPALTTDHQRLVHWLQLTPHIPVGFLCHNEDMWFGLLVTKCTRLPARRRLWTSCSVLRCSPGDSCLNRWDWSWNDRCFIGVSHWHDWLWESHPDNGASPLCPSTPDVPGAEERSDIPSSPPQSKGVERAGRG